jgi:hypothetical protein
MSANRPPTYVSCPRCNTPLEFGGTKQFHEGTACLISWAASSS